MNETATDVLVIGAGPSGLAVGGRLKRAGVAFELLERAPKVAPRWRDHYERLHLHTFRDLSRLPDHPWPLGVAAYPSRDQVVAYFEEHARKNGLQPRFEREVTSLRREGARWVATTRGTHGDERWSAPRAVVATGYNRVPNRPRWPGEEGFSGRVMHAAEYRNGREWLGKRALVVGSGNSGELVLYALNQAQNSLTRVFEGGSRTPLANEMWVTALGNNQLLINVGGGPLALFNPVSGNP